MIHVDTKIIIIGSSITKYYFTLAQVYGIPPCTKQALWPTQRLAESIMAYMRAPDQKLPIYVKHLAVLVSDKKC